MGFAVNSECKVCVGAVYSPGGDASECTPCSDGYILDEGQGKSAKEQCVLFCMAGTYVANSGGQCSDVGVGYWAASEHPKPKIYYFKVYDKGKLVRNFVPIYKGAKIGDCVVSENGMWDIVEQKFYPNAGTGSFTYGYGG